MKAIAGDRIFVNNPIAISYAGIMQSVRRIAGLSVILICAAIPIVHLLSFSWGSVQLSLALLFAAGLCLGAGLLATWPIIFSHSIKRRRIRLPLFAAEVSFALVVVFLGLAGAGLTVVLVLIR